MLATPTKLAAAAAAMVVPSEWIKATLVLTLLNVWLVVALLAYLERYTRRRSFRLWLVAWLFYSVHLTASLALEDLPGVAGLVAAQRAGLAIMALFLFAGSAELAHGRFSNQVLGLATVFLALWSAVATWVPGVDYWAGPALMAVLAAAGLYASHEYGRHRQGRRGARILRVGLLLWSAHLLVFPFVAPGSVPAALAHLASAALVLVIVVAMAVEQEALWAEDRYQALFESGHDAVFVLDLPGLTIRQANRAARELVGRETADLVGRPFAGLCADSCRQAASRLGDEPSVAAWECNLVRPDGTLVLTEAQGARVVEASGPVFGLSLRDLTERRLAEQALRLQSAALEVVPLSVALSDREGRLVWVNQAFTELTGYTLEEVAGQRPWVLDSPNPKAELYQELWDTVIRGRVWQGEVENRRKDGTVYREELTITPVRDPQGAITSFITVKQAATTASDDLPTSRQLIPTHG